MMLFLPPFRYHTGTYHGLTYPGHSSYAVDFNRGYGAQDQGDLVFPSAPGHVVALDPSYGVVKLDHGSGFCTVYGHMTGIVHRVGDRVDMFEVIGRIGRTAPAPEVLSPHLHIQHLLNGRAIQVAYNGCPYPASQVKPQHLYIGPEITGTNPDPSPLGVAAG